jgi:hypothetical protein
VPFFFKQWGKWLPYEMSTEEQKRAAPRSRCCAAGDLTTCEVGHWLKLGKKRAGRLLDGVEHNEFPGQVRTPDSSEKITARAVTPGAEEAGNATEEVTPPGGGGNSAPALPSAPPRLRVDKTSPEEEPK